MTALPPEVVADLKQENARLQAELRAARDRQAGSAEILRAVADTSGDAERSLQQIAETTARLFGASSVTVRTAEGDEWTRTIYVGASAQRISTEVSPEQLRIGANNLPGTVLRENRQIHIPDLANLDPSMADWPGLRVARTAGARTAVGTPLRREGKAIGTLIVHRERLAPFTEEELALLQSFADQAVIAIENARLFNETKEALERQTATAEILKVIASSPSDVQPVFEAIAASANRLIGGFSTAVYSLVDDMQHLSAFTPSNPAADAALQALFPRPLSMQPWAEQTRNGEIVHVPDIEADPTVPAKLLDVWRMRGFRGFIRVPLLRDRTTVGMISVSRVEPGPFAAHHIQLLQTFADQAVIEIENVRLFTETQEALERQTATAEILKVIASSPSDVQPVFDVIVERAVRLCGGRMGRVYRYDGGMIQMVAGHGLSVPGLGKVQQVFPRPASDDTIAGQVMLSHRPYFVTDIQHDDLVPLLSRQMIEALGTRSQVTVPMLRTGEAIGAITVGWAEPGAFGDQQVSLLQTFADQAVIAIENVRLFNETQEALERQTATADILKVIASSPDDVQPVFEAIAERSNQLVNGLSTAVLSLTDDVLHLEAHTQVSPEADAALEAYYPQPLSTFAWGQAVRRAEIIRIPDSEDELATPPAMREVARLRGWRSAMLVPLLRDKAPVGMISVTRVEPGPFADHHVQLLQTFADQAVIAIENVRLFNETQEALERQTATADILKVIASSPSDVQPVFEAIATSSNRLIGGFSTAVLRFIGDELHLAAFTPTNAAADEALKASFPRPLAEFPPFMLVRDGETVRIVDTEADDVPQLIKELARLRGYRSMLYTPLMSGGTPIGLISVTRAEPGTFAAHHTQLVRTFADQAVIAIENVRLFDEVQAKTRDLTEALTYQTGSSNILSVIASSPTDVAPVLKAIVESACQLCEAYDAVVLLKDGDDLRFSAHHGPIPINIEKWLINRNWASGRSFVDQKPVHVQDLLSGEGADFPDGRELSQHAGTAVRSILSVPLLRENESVGAILLRRIEVHPFSDKQIALLQTFADQAVIAIGNVRLFDEVQAKTRDLSESLEQQTATSEVLEVISSSPGELSAH
jgi:GAF domain-containing protein